MRRELTILIVVLTAITWLVVAYLNGLPGTWFAAARPFISAITVAGIVLWVYEKWIWHWWIFRGWLTQVPCLKGVWEVEIQSTFIDPTSNLPVVKAGFAQIDQTASQLTIRVFTDESRSVTVAHSFNEDQNVFMLAIVYENRPEIQFRERKSAFHQGSAVFGIRGYRPDAITGEYWTENKTTGNFVFRNRKAGEIGSYSQGEEIYKGR